MGKQDTSIFSLVHGSKILPDVCLLQKNGKHKTDIEIVELLIDTIKQIDNERLELSGTIKQMEDHILQSYGEVYDTSIDK